MTDQCAAEEQTDRNAAAQALTNEGRRAIRPFLPCFGRRAVARGLDPWEGGPRCAHVGRRRPGRQYRSRFINLLAEELMMSRLSAEDRDELRGREFAFPRQRKEPIEDADHVRAAVARFNQVQGVSDAERDEAWDRIKHAAKKHGVELSEASWRDIGR